MSRAVGITLTPHPYNRWTVDALTTDRRKGYCVTCNYDGLVATAIEVVEVMGEMGAVFRCSSLGRPGVFICGDGADGWPAGHRQAVGDVADALGWGDPYEAPAA